MKNVNAKKEIPLDQLKLSINTPTHVLEYKNQDQVQSRCKSSNIKIKKRQTNTQVSILLDLKPSPLLPMR